MKLPSMKPMKMPTPARLCPIEKAVSEFECNYNVMEDGPPTANAPTGESYITFNYGMELGKDPVTRERIECLIDGFFAQIARHFANMPSSSSLYWRERPHLEYDGDDHTLCLQARLLVAEQRVRDEMDVTPVFGALHQAIKTIERDFIAKQSDVARATAIVWTIFHSVMDHMIHEMNEQLHRGEAHLQ